MIFVSFNSNTVDYTSGARSNCILFWSTKELHTLLEQEGTADSSGAPEFCPVFR